MTTLKIPIRYLAMHNTSQGDVVEANIRYRETVWEIDPREAAFILVDFWDTHILRSHLERYRKITEQVIKPLLPAARSAGITVVHAPGFTIAKRYPQWEAYAEEADWEVREPSPQSWPPEDFRKRTGDYARYERPFVTPDLLEVGKELYRKRMILDSVAPQPEDFVIASGGQLHRLLEDRKILHLLYLGFSTDGCVQDKDYGIKAMGKKGYNIILLRDATTGKESEYSLKGMFMTEMAIKQIELYRVTTTVGAVRSACEAIAGG